MTILTKNKPLKLNTRKPSEMTAFFVKQSLVTKVGVIWK